jgi:hypothetical protein
MMGVIAKAGTYSPPYYYNLRPHTAEFFESTCILQCGKLRKALHKVTRLMAQAIQNGIGYRQWDSAVWQPAGDPPVIFG